MFLSTKIDIQAPVSEEFPRESTNNLASAILVQAVRDLMSPKKSSQKDWAIWQDDALGWFFSAETTPGSFYWVCEVLDISEWGFRKGVRAFERGSRKQQEEISKKLSGFQLRQH